MKETIIEKFVPLKTLITRKRLKLTISIVMFSVFILYFFNGETVSAALGWFVDDQEVKDFLIKYQDHLKFTQGGFGNLLLHQIIWGIIKGAYWICSAIENLVPEALSVFSFVNSTGITDIYKSIINTVVVSLMTLSIIIIGFKIITNNGNIDLKTIGMNIIMSVVLILLMPTLITSGIEFSKTFYEDSTSLTSSEGGVAWKLIEDGVSDLIYVNEHDVYGSLGDEGAKKNDLKTDNFYVYDFSEVITPDDSKEMEDQNSTAKNLQYKLVADGNGDLSPVEIKKGFLSYFSDSFTGGYYRYNTSTFSLLTGLIALSVAYVFSLFVIISTVIELAFKRILAPLVIATDIETGQKSKMVLSDIMQAYLTVGFQGFSLSFFTLFINYIGSGGGSDLNPVIKGVAYIAAVFVLIKGSGTVMRYFGVDIGVKEGFSQMAAAFGAGAMVFRGGKKVMPNRKGKDTGNSNNEEDSSRSGGEPERNFGSSIRDKANKVGRGIGYASSRGVGGIANDALSTAGNVASKPFKSVNQGISGTKQSFDQGLTEGTTKAVQNSMRSSDPHSDENSKLESRTLPSGVSIRNPHTEEQIANTAQISTQSLQRTGQEPGNNREEMIRENRQRSQQELGNNREEMIRENRQRSQQESGNNREEMIRENRQRSQQELGNVREKAVRENVQPASQGSRSAREQTVQERVQTVSQAPKGAKQQVVKETVQSAPQGSRSTREQTVQERVQTASQAPKGMKQQVVKETVQSAPQGSRSTREQTVQEKVQTASQKPKGMKQQVVKETVQSAPQGSRSAREQTVQERVQTASQVPKGMKKQVIRETVNQAESKERDKLNNNDLFKPKPKTSNILFDKL